MANPQEQESSSFAEDWFANITGAVTGAWENLTGEDSPGDHLTPDSGPLALAATIVASPITAGAELAQAGIGALAWVDDAISRPVSTIGQAFNWSNPLYRDGVQIEDFMQMWEASEYISPGRQLVTNLGTGIGTVGSALGIDPIAGNTDWNQFSFSGDYDPYALGAAGTEKLWDDSVLGTIGSTSLDATYQIFGVGKGLGVAGKALSKTAGVNRNVEGLRDLRKLAGNWQQHQAWRATAGAEGKRTVYGTHIEDLALTDDPWKIYNNPLVEGSSKRVEMADLISKTQDPNLVDILVRADHGDAQAVAALFQQAPDYVWKLTDMNSAIRSKFLDGGDWVPDAATAQRMKKAFDALVDRDEFARRTRDMLMSEESGMLQILDGGGSLTVNNVRTAMRGPAGTMEKWARDRAAAVRAGEGLEGSFVSRRLGGLGTGKPSTVVLQWLGGRKPTHLVSLSGTRPNDIVDELFAYAGSGKQFRGTRKFNVLMDLGDGNKRWVETNGVAWRTDAFQRLSEAQGARGQIGALETMRELEEELASAIFYKYVPDSKRATALIQKLRERKETSVASAAERGYFYDETGDMVQLTPQTQRQLADNYSLIPLRELQRMAAREREHLTAYNAAINTGEAADRAFEFVQRVWRTSVLFKPGYSVKNAIAEPLLASILAHGSILTEEGLFATGKNFAKNMDNRFKGMAYWVSDRVNFPGSQRSLSRQVDKLHYARHHAQLRLNDAVTELESLRAGISHTPSQAAKWGKVVENEVRQAGKILDTVEARLRQVDPDFLKAGDVQTIPQIMERVKTFENISANPGTYAAQARVRIKQIRDDAAKRTNPTLRAGEQAEIDALDSLASLADRVATGKADIAADVQRARAALTETTRRYNSPVRDPSVDIDKIASEIAKIDAKLGVKTEALGRAGRLRENARERFLSGQGVNHITVNGKKVESPGMYFEGDYSSAGWRVDSSAGYTTQMTLDPAGYVSAHRARSGRTGAEAVYPNQRGYWEEYAHIANQQFRGDPLFTRIMRGDDLTSLRKWLTEDLEGRRWASKMEVDPAGINGFLAEKIRQTDQYFPDEGFRNALLDHEVTASELRAAMGGRGDLTPVHAGEFEFVREADIRKGLSRALDKIWRLIATTPEDRVARMPFANRQFQRNVQSDVQLLVDQGVPLSVDTINAVRRNAKIRALRETEQTFYTIRRYSNPVYAMKYVMGFPGAYFNSLYRFARLGVLNPGRATVAANAWTSVYKTIGVDNEGNPVGDDWKKATGIVLEVPESMRKAIPSENIRISTGSWEFFGGMPSGSWLVGMAANTLVQHKPDMNKWLKETLGEKAYNVIFPFGRPTSDGKFNVLGVDVTGVVPSWVNEIYKALQSQDEDHVQAAVQLYQYQLAEWDRNGRVGPKPRPEDAERQAVDFFKIRFLTKFLVPGGIMMQPEGEYMRDKWREVTDRYPNDYAKQREAFLTENGEWAHWFTTSSSKYQGPSFATQDTYKTLQDHSSLAIDILQLDHEDPDLVSILTADVTDDFDVSVYNWMSSNTLPGGSDPIRSKLSPAEFEAKAQEAAGWQEYTSSKAVLQATMEQYGYRSLQAEGKSAWLYAQWDQYKQELARRYPAWGMNYQKYDGLKAKRTVEALSMAANNESYRASRPTSRMWTAVDRYLANRQIAVDAMALARDSEERAAISEQWRDFVEMEIVPTSGQFGYIYSRWLDNDDLAE